MTGLPQDTSCSKKKLSLTVDTMDQVSVKQGTVSPPVRISVLKQDDINIAMVPTSEPIDSSSEL